jgi:hypothetical protein
MGLNEVELVSFTPCMSALQAEIYFFISLIPFLQRCLDTEFPRRYIIRRTCVTARYLQQLLPLDTPQRNAQRWSYVYSRARYIGAVPTYTYLLSFIVCSFQASLPPLRTACHLRVSHAASPDDAECGHRLVPVCSIRRAQGWERAVRGSCLVWRTGGADVVRAPSAWEHCAPLLPRLD